MGIVKELVQRADSWVNAMTGLGTLRDKLMHAQVVPGCKLQDVTLESLFNDDDVARRVVAKLPREATRRGFKIVLEGDDEGDDDEAESADIEREMLDGMQKLDAMPKLRDGWIWARLYGGGSGVFVGADDGRPVEQPLNEAGIRTIAFLNLLKRPQLSIKQRYEDVQAPKYGEPEIYTVNQASAALAPRNGIDIHESRLILFDGAMTARMTMDSPTGFDDSVLQAAMTTLQQTATAWQSVAHLMTDASQGVLKIANLVDLVAADGGEVLRSRVQLMDLARSVCRAILVDAEKESFERVATSFAGLPEVMDKLMMRMSAAAEQPVTLLYGRSPAGMNATGESDIRGWYDTVAEGQSDEYKPRLERLIRLMFAAKDGPTRGRTPKNWCIEFNPLWQPTDAEAATTKKTKADTYVALVGAQIMTDAEAGLGLAPDFPTIDVEAREELAEADKAEGLRPREVNTPPELPEDAGPDGGGGGGGGAPARGDGDREDAQARVPKGDPRGGQWTSGGGATGGKAEALAAIRKSAASGKSTATVALQQKITQRYGVPLAKAALMYERDIKLQLKAAKVQRAGEAAAKRAAKAAVDEALGKSLGAMRQAVNAKDATATKQAAKKAAAAAKAKATRAANKAKKEAEAKAKAEAEKAASGPHHRLGEISEAATKDLPAAREATTRVVQDYLGLSPTVRHALGTHIDHRDLSHDGWAGYNSSGNITLDSKIAADLKNKAAFDALPANYAALNKLEKRRIELFNKGETGSEAVRLRNEANALMEQTRQGRQHRGALVVTVHEELHSFGPSAHRSGMYYDKGKVAEEVTTEVLARDIVLGAEARSPGFVGGAYQRQVGEVMNALQTAATKTRPHAEHYETLIKASRAYKRSTKAKNYDLMETLHEHILATDDRYDGALLLGMLNKVTVP